MNSHSSHNAPHGNGAGAHRRSPGVGQDAPAERGFASIDSALKSAVYVMAVAGYVDAGLASWLRMHRPGNVRLAAWEWPGLVTAARYGDLSGIVEEEVPGRFSLPEQLREAIVGDWRASKTGERQYRELSRRLAEYCDERVEVLSRTLLDPRESDQDDQDEITTALQQGALQEQGLLHWFAYDANVGFEQFERLFQGYERRGDYAACRQLVAVAELFSQAVSERHRLWLDHYRARAVAFPDAWSRGDWKQKQDARRARGHQLRDLLVKLESSTLTNAERAELEGWTRMELGQSILEVIPLVPHAPDRVMQELQAALEEFRRAADAFQQLGHSREQGAAENTVGIIYERMGHAERASQWYKAAVRRSSEGGDLPLGVLGILYLNLGSALEDLADRTERPELSEQVIGNYERAAAAFRLADFDYGRGLALLNIGRFMAVQGDLKAAEPYLSESLRALAVLEVPEAKVAKHWLERARSGTASLQLEHILREGEYRFNRGEYLRAIDRFEEAASQAVAQGNIDSELEALGWLALSWSNVGGFHKAIDAATRQLARARQANDPVHEMRATLSLARALAEIDLRGRWHEIRPLLLDGLARARQMGDHSCEVDHLLLLGRSSVQVGELEQALAWLQEALAGITADIDYAHSFLSGVYCALSLLLLKRANSHEAVRYAEMAVGEARLQGNPSLVSDAQLTLARADRTRGERLAALRLTREVQSTARRRGWRVIEQEAALLRAELEQDLGQSYAAEGSARRSRKLARKLNRKEGEVTSLLTVGQALVAQGRTDEAHGVLQQARRLSQERDYPDHFERAEQLLAQLAP